MRDAAATCVDVGSDDDLPQPEILIHAALRPRGAARRHGGEHQPDHPHRHARRSDAERRQVHPARSADADPRQPASARRAATWRRCENLPVPTSGGGTVPLKAVADFSFGEGPTAIHSYDQSLRIAIDADLNGIELGTGDEGDPRPADAAAPAARRAAGARPAARSCMNELFADFGIAMGTGILMVFAVLVLLFARVLQPLTILSSLPLSLGGAVVGAAADAQSAVAGRDDRLPDADGHRRQELHPAGRLRDRGDARRQGSPDRAHGGRPQARPADRHDHGRHDRGHAAGGARRRRCVPRAHGDRGDRRPDHLDRRSRWSSCRRRSP